MEEKRDPKTNFAGPSPAFVISVLALGLFMVNLDASIVNIVLPSMAKIFKVDTSEVSRVVLAYLLSFSGFLLIFGRLSDLRGAGKIFSAGFFVFTLASAFCAMSGSLFALEAARFFQGVGAAMLASTYGAIIIQMLPPEMRGRAFGLVTVAGGVGFAVGAPLGGYLTTNFDWRYIFWINIPVGVFSLLVSSRLPGRPPGSKDGQAGGFDPSGAAVSFVGLALLTWLLNSGKSFGLASALFIGGAGLFAALFAAFTVIERRAAAPLVDLTLFSNRDLTLSFVSNLAVVMTLDGMNFLFPFFFELGRGMKPDRIGLLLMIFPLLSMVVSPLAGIAADRRGPRAVCAVSAAMLAVSAAMFCLVDLSSHLYFIIAAFVVFGCALAMFFTANSSLLMSHAPEGREGTTSALLSFNANLGTLLGVCFFESIFSFGLPAGMFADAKASPAPGLIAKGFNHGALFALLICVTAAAASFMARERAIPSLPGDVPSLPGDVPSLPGDVR